MQVAELVSSCAAYGYELVSGQGLFINRDPIEEAGGINLYGFCSNDGVNGYDYLGMEENVTVNDHDYTKNDDGTVTRHTSDGDITFRVNSDGSIDAGKDTDRGYATFDGMGQLGIGSDPMGDYQQNPFGNQNSGQADSLLVGIDGTGSSKWRVDSPDGSSRNSHVANMVHAFKGGGRLYLNGPNTLGTNVRLISDRAIAFIHAQLLANPNMLVNLVGHSRGGLIAINIANQLQSGFSDVNGGAPVRVNFLGLFDAVDRAVGMDGSRIGNVDTVFHEIRDPAGGSRSWFGNTGLSSDYDVNYTSIVLMGTHSAIGGDPGHGDYQRTNIPLGVEMNTGTQAYQLMIAHAVGAGLPF